MITFKANISQITHIKGNDYTAPVTNDALCKYMKHFKGFYFVVKNSALRATTVKYIGNSSIDNLPMFQIDLEDLSYLKDYTKNKSLQLLYTNAFDKESVKLCLCDVSAVVMYGDKFKPFNKYTLFSI